MTCSTCRYWKAGNAYLDQTLDSEPTKGECRRRAPVGISVVWPVTGWKDWCGEFDATAPLRGKYEVEIGEGKMKVLGFEPAGPEDGEKKVDNFRYRAEAAIYTLDTLGYTYHGGPAWRPPLGPAPEEKQDEKR